MLMELRLRKIRLREQNKLNESYLFLYRDITSYIRNSSLLGYEKEEILQQIMDMMLEAQEDNKAIDLVIGKDYEVFCKSIIEEYMNYRRKEYRLLRYIQKYLIWLTFLIILFCSVGMIINQSTSIRIKVNDLIFANAWAMVFMPFVKETRQVSITNYIKQKNYFAYLFRGMYSPKRNILLVLLAVLVLFFGTKYILINLYGASIINYQVSLIRNAKYFVILLLGILAIEIYQKVYDKKKY
jgi:DNA-binding ferritin-like protein (Dps family)